MQLWRLILKGRLKPNSSNNLSQSFLKTWQLLIFMRILGSDLERWISIVEASEIESLEIKGGFRDFFQRVKIGKRKGAPVISCYLPPPPLPTKKERNMKKREELKYREVTSHGVGTFYTIDPRVDSKVEPYVKKGSKVKKGQVLGLMKHLRNMYDEIVAPCDCKITDIYLENNSPIEYKTPLFQIRPRK